MFAAGLMLGTWWVVLAAGIAVLILKRSYVVLLVGVVLDLWFAAHGGVFAYIGFYTAIFLVTTIVVETVRKKLFWVS